MTEPPLQPTPNRLIYPILEAMRNCMHVQFAHVDNPVCYLPIIWGDSPLPAQRCDCTCEDGGNGEAWIRVVRIEQIQLAVGGSSRSTRASGANFAAIDCGPRVWNVTVETGVWRCAPTFDATTRQAPSDDEYDAHTQIMLNDSAALGRVWRCCDWLKDRELTHQADTSVPSGPSGGCVGVIVTGRIKVEECTPCP